MKNANTLDQKVDLILEKIVKIDGLETTIEHLAISTKNSFDEIFKRMDSMDARFDQIDDRFARIENISIGGHERRIDNLEDDMRVVKSKVGLK
jgi:hypothetical protein